jgi:hypothetical protein
MEICMTTESRLESLKKFMLENLPNDRTRHCLLEILAVLQEQKQGDIISAIPRKKGLRHGTNEKNLS